MRPSLTTVRLAGLLAMAVLVGCDSSGDPIPFSQLQTAAVTAVCHVDVLCGSYPDQATCMASAYARPHFFDTLSQDVASGKVTYDGALARTCIDAIKGVSSCARSTLATVDVNVPCDKVFTGTVAAGGDCFFKEECVGGGACLTASSCSSGQCCVGTCQPPKVIVPLGGDCSTSAQSCATGTVCVSEATSGARTCQKPVAAGGTCTSSSVCAAGLYCDMGSTCQRLVATGGICNPAMVGSIDCDNQADHCDSVTSVCTPRLSLGSPCITIANICVSYAACDTASGTCVERPLVGAACSANGPSCLAGSCDQTSATCVLNPTAGACS
jgi:hypothetical protein